jgi:uncharacterized protein (DUF305 family)
MKLKNHLTLFTLGSIALLVSVGFSACTTSPSETQAEQSSAPAVAQSPMSGMEHGSGMSMQGMEHSSDLGAKDESFDLRFIDAMIPHHQKTVEIAQEALQKSNRPEIKEMAQTLIDAQEQEISQMKEWRATWYPDADNTPMMYDTTTKQTVPMTEEPPSSGGLGDADAQFDLRLIDAMIPHFEGGIDMAKQALQNSDRPEMQQLAQSIIDSQQQEIDQIKQWKQQWYRQ